MFFIKMYFGLLLVSSQGVVETKELRDGGIDEVVVDENVRSHLDPIKH